MRKALEDYMKLTCKICKEKNCEDCGIELNIIRLQEIHEQKLREKDKEILRLGKLFKRQELARQNIDNFKEYICDNLCQYPCVCRNEKLLMEMCEDCQVEEYLEALGGAE